jgi:hypothetical protein
MTSNDEVISDEIVFRGHENVRALHPTTIEITRDNAISMRADCVIGVGADKGCGDLNENLRRHIRSGGALRLELTVGTERFAFYGQGDPRLSLDDSYEVVFRRSNFISPRTCAIKCSAASLDIPRNMISKLKSREALACLKIVALS